VGNVHRRSQCDQGNQSPGPHPFQTLPLRPRPRAFRDSDSRSFLMVGRTAREHQLALQSAYRARTSPTTGTMYQAANEAMSVQSARRRWAVQWHGMASDSCRSVEVYNLARSSTARRRGQEPRAQGRFSGTIPPGRSPSLGARVQPARTDNVSAPPQRLPVDRVRFGGLGYSGKFCHRAGPRLPCARHWLPAVR